MATSGNLLTVVLLVSFSFNAFGVERECDCSVPVERDSFPKGFVFGAGTSSYQIEGAYNEDGKGLSIWDNYTHTHPERIANESNGDVAVDSYHRYKEDVCMAKQLGLDAYKFQISWSRILPNGKTVNPKAIVFYNNLINELTAQGDSAREPYVVGHHLLLADLAVVESYRKYFQPYQKGKIGIQLCMEWPIPYTNTEEDQAAQRRALDAQLGWYMDPLVFGRYPKTMRRNVGNRLPNFTASESKRLIGSFDFIGLNYYLSQYVLDDPTPIQNVSCETDAHVKFTDSRDNVSLCNPGSFSWICNHPPGIRESLIYLHGNCSVPLIYITEN
ncbi:unnamed protein product, partial [Ilex paraguariensis]